MRLNQKEISAIRAATRLTFGPHAVVRLYGSRVDDGARGGDIDLHIETPEPVDIWRMKDAFLERLFARIDEQRVDVIASTRGQPASAIERIAYRDGVVL